MYEDRRIFSFLQFHPVYPVYPVYLSSVQYVSRGRERAPRAEDRRAELTKERQPERLVSSISTCCVDDKKKANAAAVSGKEIRVVRQPRGVIVPHSKLHYR